MTPPVRKTTLRRSLFALLAFSFCASLPAQIQQAPDARPKLVVGIVIDQFRYDYLLRFRQDYNSGLARMLDQGAVFSQAHYAHSYTVTAVGHSTFMSGATPSASGIIGNEWFEREGNKGSTVTSVSDPNTKLVGGVPGMTGSSPRRLLVSTVGDELKMRGGDSRVIGIAIKDRAAILPSGHTADGAYWYDNDSNHWVTSSYYAEDLPAWVKDVNDRKSYQRTLGAQWLPLDAKPDAKPFCTMTNGSEIRFCGTVEATPWGNELIEEFAEAAIAGENLGQHSSPDLLTVSFSSNDYVGHQLGPDHPAVRDISIRTDRLLGKLMDFIDQRVGLGNTLFVLTADHGVSPVPEVNQKRNMPGGRIPVLKTSKTVNDALVKRWGPGNWLMPGGLNTPYLNYELIQKYKADPEAVERLAADTLRKTANIARVYTRHELERGMVQKDAIGDAISRSFFGPRYGDLYVLQEPYYLFEDTGTSHGTPYDYDTHVPLIFMGQGIRAGNYSRNVLINDVAPTLAAMLQINTPSGASGQVLPEVMPLSLPNVRAIATLR